MEKKYGQANRVWVMDRGMVSEANLKFLRQRGGSYIVGTPKAFTAPTRHGSLRRFARPVHPLPGCHSVTLSSDV